MKLNRLRIDGYREVTSSELRTLIQEAKELEYDRLFPPDVIDRLDPKGVHLICARPTLLDPDTDPEVIERHPGGTDRVTRAALKTDTAMPCEVMTKLAGVTATPDTIPTFMLDIKVDTFLHLRTVPFAEMEQARMKPRNGQHRGNV